MVASHHKTTVQTVSALSPATKSSWRFGDLTAAELMPQLRRYLLAQDAKANWQLVWLNNDGRPVIGLLPKVSWSVFYCADETSYSDKKVSIPQANLYKIQKNCRAIYHNNDNAITTAYMSYSDWQDELIAYSQAYESDNEISTSINNNNEKSNYHHGLIGFIGYDIAAHELSPAAQIELACALLGHYDIYLSPSKDDEKGWQLTVKTLSNDSDKSIDNKKKDKLVAALMTYLDKLNSKLSRIDIANNAKYPLLPLKLDAKWHKNDYQQAFNQTQNYLQQGDCYQINLTQVWSADFSTISDINNVSDLNDGNKSATALIDYLPALHGNTQAPFAGYLAVNYSNSEINTNTPERQFELLSCSPELFFTFTKDNNTGKHHIRTKPIKGTMPRGATAEQDDAYKQQLINSEKDRAENVMIVDLLRNDLGKYAKIGSVKVPQLFAIESFSNVHHMVSTITAELKADTHPLAVLFGSLPAGSITGTPKKRAVEIIAELEIAPRGAYCGTMGYMNFDGSGQWNVLIRTLQANHASGDIADHTSQISLWAGGGITIASDCDAEYQECLDKVGNLLSVLATADND
ncbi:anthranilate synthase component I family protein [Psychrobacter sp.]|uniref:anthranilate synthase component I family protein n=1 Tax=Psychrobacter sp. TaxID=56811 RepID=UPI003BAFB2A5